MILCIFIQLLCTVVFVILVVAFFTLYERKVLGSLQYRNGPDKVILAGVVQPITDALKLITNVESSPLPSYMSLYWASPGLGFILSLVVWLLIPVEWGLSSIVWSIIMLMIYFSLSVYSVISMGWYSNSKYSTLGCVRASTQSVSFEIGLAICIVYFLCEVNSLSISGVIEVQSKVWLIFPWMVILWVVFLAIVAETNRPPFDLAEGESELVSGFCVEYGGTSYTLLFLAENLSVIWSCYVLSALFGGGSVWTWMGGVFTYVWLRGSLPRMRFDQVMMKFWLVLLPLALSGVSIYLMIY